jgi:hypothetical protein
MSRILGISVVVLAVAWWVLGTDGMAQSPSSVAKSTNTGQPAQSVLATAPECPLINTNATTHQSETEPILVTYGSGTKGALRAAKLVTLHAAAVRMGGTGTVQDFPMVRQADGTWLATVTLEGSAVNSGYVMFDVEDQDHHIDRNDGAYWDTQLCYTNPNIPKSRYPWGSSFSVKMNSYNGHVIVPGFQRAADPARALEIVREDFAKYPQDYGDLFWIWTFETKNGRGSAKDWDQVSRRHGLEPYRYRRQRDTTVVVRAPDSFINNNLWPEFLQIKGVRHFFVIYSLYVHPLPPPYRGYLARNLFRIIGLASVCVAKVVNPLTLHLKYPESIGYGCCAARMARRGWCAAANPCPTTSTILSTLSLIIWVGGKLLCQLFFGGKWLMGCGLGGFLGVEGLDLRFYGEIRGKILREWAELAVATTNTEILAAPE